MSRRFQYKNYEFLEWMRANVLQGGADAFAETEIKTPVGRATNIALALFCVDFEFADIKAIATGEIDVQMMQLTKNSKAAEIYIDDSDLIEKSKFTYFLLTSGTVVTNLIERKVFPRPILYAKSSIYIAIDSTGLGAAVTGYCRIGYVLRYVHPNVMNRALTE